MNKGTKKRKTQVAVEGAKAKDAKKRKLAAVEETNDTPEASAPPSTKRAVHPENDPYVFTLRKEIAKWMEQQAEFEKKDVEALLEESNHSDDQEEVIDFKRLETPLGEMLQGYSEYERQRSFKFECEWRKCTYMSGTDRKYFLHVESHAQAVIDSQPASYACEWDLCHFVTEDDYEYMGHVHYHAYHTKLKVHGASVQMLAKLIKCNLDSRTRNTIPRNQPVTFRCEWDNCDERFNKAMHFFHHVHNHVADQYPPGKKSSPVDIPCRWSLCKETFRIRYKSMMHIRRHTSEREIACYNCGTCFFVRVKLHTHLARHIEMSQRRHQCPVCGRFYATNALMKAHHELHDKAYPCSLCPKRLESKSALASHMLRIHIKQRNFKCNQCEHAAFSKRELDSHMETHNKTKIFRCEEFGCDAAYRSIYSIRKHFAWHYNLPPTLYGCHLCDDKTYKNSYHLTKHLRFVHKLERAPGYFKFGYKLDSDGVLRLNTYVEQKMMEQRQAKAKALETPLDDTVTESQNDDQDGRKKRKKKAPNEKAQATSSSAANQEESTGDAAAFAPIQGKPKINAVKAIGVHEFLIELGIEVDPAKAKPQPEPQSEDESNASGNDSAKAAKHSSVLAKGKCDSEQSVELEEPHGKSSLGKPKPPQASQQPKDVKDFTVMKRYLKPSKKSA